MADITIFIYDVLKTVHTKKVVEKALNKKDLHVQATVRMPYRNADMVIATSDRYPEGEYTMIFINDKFVLRNNYSGVELG